MNALTRPAGHRLRVFVVSGHPVIEMGWSAMLLKDGGFDLVGSASSGSSAIAAISSAVASIDLVLVDCELPDMSGAELVQTLLPLHPPLRFALLTGRLAPAVPHDAMITAARTCQVHREASVAELTRALRSLRLDSAGPSGAIAVTNGPAHGSNDGSHTSQGNGPALGNNLTQRERELLALMGLGLSNQQISDRLNIAMPTVKFHVTHILSKMGADNRTEAVLLGLRHGLVQLQ